MKGKDVFIGTARLYMRYELMVQSISTARSGRSLSGILAYLTAGGRRLKLLLRHVLPRKQGKVFFGDDPLCGEMNRWTIFLAPIAGLIEAKLEHRAGLDVIVQPGCASPTVRVVISSKQQKRQGNIGQSNCEFVSCHIFKKETLLITLKSYFTKILDKSKTLKK